MSRERFLVIYSITGNEKDAYAKAKDICLEQTVEYPDELVPDGFIREHILGRIKSFSKKSKNKYIAGISFDAEISGFEFTQLLNVIFGNISIKPNIRVESINLAPSLLKMFKGPRFGITGLRRLLKVKRRPLLCAPIKPLGLDNKRLSELAYQFALGGIDIIKDDHGITNQSFSPFKERVRLCAKAVQKANKETGQNCIYVANVTAGPKDIIQRSKFAKENGAGGLMIAPGIVGFDTMRQIAEDNFVNLPIFSHPAFQGTYVINQNSGISHYALFGQLVRLAGADASIFPNYGGRFLFTKEDCANIAKGSAIKMGRIKPIFPCPGGGMSLNRVPEMLKLYGNEVIFLIGGSLVSHGPDLVENCMYFKKMVSPYNHLVCEEPSLDLIFTKFKEGLVS